MRCTRRTRLRQAQRPVGSLLVTVTLATVAAMVLDCMTLPQVVEPVIMLALEVGVVVAVVVIYAAVVAVAITAVVFRIMRAIVNQVAVAQAT